MTVEVAWESLANAVSALLITWDSNYSPLHVLIMDTVSPRNCHLEDRHVSASCGHGMAKPCTVRRRNGEGAEEIECNILLPI